MSDPGLVSLVVLPIAFGLIGFIEPCSIGATLVLIKFLEGKDARTKVAQVVMFAVTRAIFIGLLGVAAALLGASFFALQKAAWAALGVFFIAIGLVLAVGRGPLLMATIGPSLGSLSGARGSIGLGLLFGLNIPACALPLLIALLAAAAAQGATGGTLTAGFVSLALFGLAMSLPLVAAVLFEPARRALDRLARLSQSLPLWTGLILIALGLWSMWFGIFARLGV